MSVVILPTGYYPDPTIGKPVSEGYIYVGDPDTDPEVVANQRQISVLQEDTTTIDVSQPLRTSSGGVPVYNGSPVTILVTGDYSLKVLDSDEVQVYYIPNSSQTEDTSISIYNNDLTAAVADIGATETNLTIDSASVVITANTVVPANITLVKTREGFITGAFTLAINGTMTGDLLTPWFASNVTVSGLSFATPEMWLENTTEGTTDMTAALVAADAALVDGGLTELRGGDTYLFTNFTVSSNRTIKSTGKNSTILKSITSGIAIDLSENDYVTIEGVQVDGVSQTAGSIGILFSNSNNNTFRDLWVRRFETGIKFDRCVYANFYNLNVSTCTTGIKVITDSGAFTANNFYGGKIFSCTTGMDQEVTSLLIQGNLFSGMHIESNGTGVKLDGVRLTSFDTCWFEGNSADHLVINSDSGTETFNITANNTIFQTLAGGGIDVSGAFKNIVFRDSLLNSITVTVAGTSSYVEFNDCFDSGASFVGTRIVRNQSTSAYPEQKTYNNNQARQITGQLTSDSTDFDSNIATIQTTDAAATTLAAITLAASGTYYIEATILAQHATKRAAYKLGGLFWNNAGVATQEGSTVFLLKPATLDIPTAADPGTAATAAQTLRTDINDNLSPSVEAWANTANGIESDAGWSCVYDTSGAAVRLRVTGIADVNWSADIKVIKR